jgi:hypothetical protein
MLRKIALALILVSGLFLISANAQENVDAGDSICNKNVKKMLEEHDFHPFDIKNICKKSVYLVEKKGYLKREALRKALLDNRNDLLIPEIEEIVSEVNE